MTKALAKELIRNGIRVNAVNPGATAEEIASVIVFLASDEASHVIGEAIEINGVYGWTSGPPLTENTGEHS